MPIYASMLDCGRMVLRLELFHHFLDLLGFRARADQNGIGGRNNNKIFYADHGREHAILRTYE